MNRSHPAEVDSRWRRGVAAVEFALVAPFLLLALLAGADLSVFIRIQMNLDQTSTEMAQNVTQYSQLYSSDFTTLFNASQTLAGSTPVTGLLGTTIITGIINSNGRQTIAWQQRSPSATFSSLFGTAAGATPTLPNNYVVPAGNTLIAVEVFTTASPWVFSAGLMGHSSITSLRSFALFQSRLSSLATITSGTRP
jgi:Flp pilus assembly protein TadG